MRRVDPSPLLSVKYLDSEVADRVIVLHEVPMRADGRSLQRLGVAFVAATVYLVAAFAVLPLLGQESTSFRHERLTLASSAGPLT